MRKTVLKNVEFLNVDAAADEIEAVRLDGQGTAQPAATRRADAAEVIARNLARLRLAAGLDVATLAERSDLKPEQIALIESGGGLPGLRALWRIAKALSVPFGVLVDGTIMSEASDGDFRVQRAGEGHVIASPGGMQSRVLSPPGVADVPEVYELALRPGGAETADGHAPATCEHIVVIEGRLLLQAGDHQVELAAGDSLFFRADIPHRYVNPGGGDMRALLVMMYA